MLINNSSAMTMCMVEVQEEKKKGKKGEKMSLRALLSEPEASDFTRPLRYEQLYTIGCPLASLFLHPSHPQSNPVTQNWNQNFPEAKNVPKNICHFMVASPGESI